jgi:hypothetical protein
MNTLFRVSSVIGVATAILIAAEPARAGVDPHLGPAVASIVEEAAKRLESPGCALVLQDFVDGRTGRPLAETLTTSGLSASEHVRSLEFTPSPRPPRLGALRIYAYTHPGDSRVFVCRLDFERLLPDRKTAAAVVIHEALHTLGLANDLPSSELITERVLARCGTRPR